MSTHLTVERIPSPIGHLLLACDHEGALRALELHDDEAGLKGLLDRHCPGHAVSRGPIPASIRDPLAAFFDGQVHALDGLRVQTGGTEFQRRVWAELRKIPAGSTWSYGQLAAAIGRPGASRAVGLANGANPVAIVVPCHRVIGASGTLTGYGGGLERKKWLLDHEFRWTAPLFARAR